MLLSTPRRLWLTAVMAIAFTAEHAGESCCKYTPRWCCLTWCACNNVGVPMAVDQHLLPAMYLAIGRALDISVSQLGTLSMWRALVQARLIHILPWMVSVAVAEG